MKVSACHRGCPQWVRVVGGHPTRVPCAPSRPFPAGAGGRSRGQSQPWSGRPAPFRSWDSGLYRPWQEGTPRQRDCWRGGCRAGHWGPRWPSAPALSRCPGRWRCHLRHQQRRSHHVGRRGHLLHRPPLPQHPGGAARRPHRLEPELHHQRSAPAQTTPRPPALHPPLTLCPPQAPASPRGSPSSQSSRTRARTASSPMGSRFPPAPRANPENSSMSGGRGVRPAPTPAGAQGVPEAVPDPPTPSHRALLAGCGWCRIPADGGDGGGAPGLLHHGGGRLPLPRPPEVHPHRPRQHPVQHHGWVLGPGWGRWGGRRAQAS